MSTVYQVNVSTGPQRFNIVLNGVTYHWKLKWNTFMGLWILYIYDVNDVPIITGLPVVAGVDLLGQYAYLGLRFSVFAMTVGDINTPPTFENLGTDGQIFVITP